MNTPKITSNSESELDNKEVPFTEHFLDMEWEQREDLPQGVWRRLLRAERCQWATRHLIRLLSVDEISKEDAETHKLTYEGIKPATREAYWLAISELSGCMDRMFEEIRDGDYK